MSPIARMASPMNSLETSVSTTIVAMLRPAHQNVATCGVRCTGCTRPTAAGSAR